jgi:hypothetical protein
METQEKYKSRIFKGAGILIGFVLGSVVGIVVASITGIIGLIGAIAASVALPTGLYIERKFQGEQAGRLIEGQKTYLLLFLIGVVLFFICFFLVK